MKKRLLSVLLILALAFTLLPAVALAGNDLTGFTDAASISSDALPAMQWAVAQAIIRGDNFQLNPQSGATALRRARCSPLLCNLNLFGPERRFLPVRLTKNGQTRVSCLPIFLFCIFVITRSWGRSSCRIVSR